MVSVSVRHLFYQSMDEKIKTWPLHFPAKETIIWSRHCSIGLLSCSMTSKRSIDWSSRAWSFLPERSLNQPKATRVCICSINQIALLPLGKILWSIPTETFLEFLPALPDNKATVTNVPAPTIPMAKIELCATSASLSWDSLLRVSIILSWGLEAERRARANGTARRITGSPYCSWNKTTTTLLQSGHLISLHEGKTENLLFARRRSSEGWGKCRTDEIWGEQTRTVSFILRFAYWVQILRKHTSSFMVNIVVTILRNFNRGLNRRSRELTIQVVCSRRSDQWF